MAAEGRKMARRNNETAQKILAAAFKCIAERGSASIGLREIAEEAGVVLSQLNYYFVNRERLFAAVLRMMKQNYLASIEVEMATRRTMQQKAHFLITYNRELLVSNQGLYRAFLDFYGLALWSPSFRKEMNEFLNDLSQVMEGKMEPASSSGAGESLRSAAVLTNMILAASFGIAMQFLMSPERNEPLQGFDLLLQLIPE